MNDGPFSEAERRAFAALSDALIPSARGHLSASEAGIAGPLLDRVAAVVPERLALLRAVIDRTAGQDPAVALDAMRQEDSVAYDGFCETVAAAYFMAPVVRDHVRYPGRVPVPAKSDVVDLEDLLMPVLEAGFEPRGMDL